MCIDPISVISMALGAAQSLAGFAAKQREADAQTQRYNENVANSLAASRDSQRQITTRQEQENASAAQRTHVANVEAAQKTAEVQVSAAGGNVGGLSVDNLVADIQQATAQNLTTIETNRKATVQQLQRQQEATVTTAQGRINSMAPGTPPDPMVPMIEIAGAGVKSLASATKRG